jgi:hypothetical protein
MRKQQFRLIYTKSDLKKIPLLAENSGKNENCVQNIDPSFGFLL